MLTEDIEMGRSFEILHRRAQVLIMTACEHLGLSYSEYVLLLQILIAEGKNQEELADALGLDKSMIAKTLISLERKNLVYRELAVNDRRFKCVFPTALAQSHQPFLEEILEKWLQYLGLGGRDESTQNIRNKLRSAALTAQNANIDEFVKTLSKEE